MDQQDDYDSSRESVGYRKAHKSGKKLGKTITWLSVMATTLTVVLAIAKKIVRHGR